MGQIELDTLLDGRKAGLGVGEGKNGGWLTDFWMDQDREPRGERAVSHFEFIGVKLPGDF